MQRHLRLPAGATCAALVAFGVIAFAGAPSRADLDRSARPMWGANGTVRAVLRVGGTVFVGGDFTKIVDPRTGATVARRRIAALDAATGKPLASWNPGADATVHALAVSPDGHTVYLGGEFAHVSGARRGRLAAVRARSGTLIESFAPKADGAVMALAAAGSRVYAGGRFTTMNGKNRSRLAALNATSGAVVRAWNAPVGGTVRGLALSRNGSRLFLCGGGFTTVAGHRRLHVAAVATSSGSLLDWAPNPDRPVYGLATDASNVYAAAGGPGGHVFAFSASSGATRWQNHTDGDVVAVTVVGDQVVAGGHFSFEQGGSQERLVALRTSDGRPDRGFDPRLTGGSLGAIALGSAGKHLVVGGDFTAVNGSKQPRITQFRSG